MSKITGVTGLSGYQILSDGKSLALVWREQDEDAAIFMSEYVMSQWAVNVRQDPIPLMVDHYGWEGRILGPQSVEVDLSLRSYECRYKRGKDLMLEMDLFSRMSVTDLFKVINKKLNRR